VFVFVGISSAGGWCRCNSQIVCFGAKVGVLFLKYANLLQADIQVSDQFSKADKPNRNEKYDGEGSL